MTVMRSRGATTLIATVYVILGLALGTVGAFVQAARSQVVGITIPWGLIFVLGLLVLIIRLGVNVTRTRWAGSALFVGWLIATIGFATKTPWSADLIISSGGRQLVYLLVGVVLGSAAASIKADSGQLSGQLSGQGPVTSSR